MCLFGPLPSAPPLGIYTVCACYLRGAFQIVGYIVCIGTILANPVMMSLITGFDAD